MLPTYVIGLLLFLILIGAVVHDKLYIKKEEATSQYSM